MCRVWRLRGEGWKRGHAAPLVRGQLGGPGGEQREAFLVGIGGRQGDLDAGDHLGDAGGSISPMADATPCDRGGLA